MTKIFIYGSCTSRDAVDSYPHYSMELHSYIARQSLISAFNPVTAKIGNFRAIESSFQRRMVVWDVAGTLPGYVRKIADDVDLIVWDLTDERLSVRAVKSGGYVTGNSNTIKDAIPDILSQPIQFGTPEHLSLWEKALDDFVAVLEEIGTLDKVVVNATPWALIDNHGRPTDYPSTRIDPRWFNQTAEQYYSLIEDRRISVAWVDQADAVADSDHKWGPAYFHYVPSTYRSQLDLITALKSR